MRKKVEKVNGLKACEDAFNRLVNGTPIVSDHIGIRSSKVTAGIVSVEAGFDRGYLKKSRQSHLSLLAKIDAYRSGPSNSDTSVQVLLSRARNKADRTLTELQVLRDQFQKVVTQNLQLVERVRELEAQLGQANRHGRLSAK